MVRPRPQVTTLRLAGAVVFAAAFWMVDLVGIRAGIPDRLDDTWEYGVAARHLLAGQGFRTSVIHPPLWTLHDPSLTVPLLIHGPLMPVLAAPLIWIRGERAIDSFAWVGALFALLAVIPIVRLGDRHFGPPVGIAAAGLWTLAPLTIGAVNHDPGLAVGAFLLALALDLLWRPRPLGLAAGLAAGLATLARAEMLPAAIILGCFASGPARVGFATGALACVVPWAVHQMRATGVPFFNLSSYLLIGYWERYPGLSVLRDFHLAPARWPEALREALPGMWPKWIHDLPRAARHAIAAPTPVTGVLGLLGWWRMARSAIHAGLATLGLLLGLIPLAVITTMEPSPRYLVPFLPLWSLAAAFGLREAVQRLAASRRDAVMPGLLILLTIPFTVRSLGEAQREARVRETLLAEERAALGSRAAGDALPGTLGPSASMRHFAPARRGGPMFSDTPDFVAWTTGRPVVWVTRGEYALLPSGTGESDARERPLDLPVRGSEVDTWFHPPPDTGARP